MPDLWNAGGCEILWSFWCFHFFHSLWRFTLSPLGHCWALLLLLLQLLHESQVRLILLLRDWESLNLEFDVSSFQSSNVSWDGHCFRDTFCDCLQREKTRFKDFLRDRNFLGRHGRTFSRKIAVQLSNFDLFLKVLKNVFF